MPTNMTGAPAAAAAFPTLFDPDAEAPTAGRHPGRSAPPPADPCYSHVKIRRRLYCIETWTRAQWASIPPADRPADAWWHGDIAMRVRPA